MFVLWLGVLGASIYGFTQLEQGLDLQLLAPNGHYFIDAQDAEVEFYNLGIPFGVIAPNPRPTHRSHVNYSLAVVRHAMDDLGPAIVDADPFAASSDAIWIGVFHEFLEGIRPGLSQQNLGSAELN